MADIAGISGNGAFDAARAGNAAFDPQTEEADLQQAQDDQAQIEIEDQVTIDSENFGNAGNDSGANGGQAALEANINDTSTPGATSGAAAFNADITAAPGTEAQAGAVSGTSNAALAADARTTNQVETTETQQAGNDNESQTEAGRTLGQVIDVFA